MDQSDAYLYQRQGAAWLTGKRFALLADDMGLGKTVQAVLATQALRLKNVLVVCPAVARYVWSRHFAEWSGRSSLIVTSEKSAPATPAPTTIISYDLTLPMREWLRSRQWDLVILDEQHYLKEPAAKRTLAVYGNDGVVRNTARVWALSGTPAPNHAGELWVLLRCFGVYAGDYGDFVAEFCSGYKSRFGFQITGTNARAVPRLRNLLEPIMLRRKKEQVLKELPPITFGEVELAAGPVDFEICYPQYFLPHGGGQELLDQKLAEERGAVQATVRVYDNSPPRAAMIETILAGLADSVSSWRRYVGLKKLPGVAELVTGELEANAYDKIVIFAIHTNVIEGLRRALTKYHPVTLYGKTPAAQRDKNVYRFQNDPSCRVFIGNIAAAGTSITLTAAQHVLMAEYDWVPGNNAQAIMRCHRIGQTRPVLVRFAALAEDPLDYRIMQTFRRKARELSQVFDVSPTDARTAFTPTTGIYE